MQISLKILYKVVTRPGSFKLAALTHNTESLAAPEVAGSSDCPEQGVHMDRKCYMSNY